MAEKRTKAQLLSALERLERIHREFHDKVDKALRSVLDENCHDAIQPVAEFCDEIGIEFPTTDIHVRIPYGSEIKCMDDGFNDIEFLIINK
jgi:hypothetical protein